MADRAPGAGSDHDHSHNVAPMPGGGIEFVVAIDEAAGAGRPFDVLHDHCGYTTLAMADRQSTPVVHTVHGPFDHDTTPYYARHGAKGRLVCITRSRAEMAPAEADVAAVAYTPVDVDSWPVGYRKEDCLRARRRAGDHRARSQRLPVPGRARDGRVAAGYEAVYRKTLARAADRRRTGAPPA